ncbi:MAG: hypothetical protein BWY42_01271 [Candidatus Omnitrophica bacterium ADurb.Bin277]|jgi:hypothetical protein|nr:MAG: hypothetical protein BWY42_01271 [Candidatus Omnitrophica bacterium ADurb.Bin277]
MNHHKFLHEMAMIHAAVRRVLEKLPAGPYKKERQELLAVKIQIESYIIKPEDILNEQGG